MPRNPAVRSSGLVAAAVLAASACAGRAPVTDAPFVEEPVTRAAVLVECAGYRPAPSGAGLVRAVHVQYLVKPDGLVDPTSISVVRRPQAPPALQVQLERLASESARNCHYEPALRDGEPVPAVVRRSFRFAVPG